MIPIMESPPTRGLIKEAVEGGAIHFANLSAPQKRDLFTAYLRDTGELADAIHNCQAEILNRLEEGSLEDLGYWVRLAAETYAQGPIQEMMDVEIERREQFLLDQSYFNER